MYCRRGVVTLAHALVVARSEVLSRERGDGDAQRLRYHPYDRVEPAREAPAGDGVDAKRVDGGLHDDV